MTACKSTSDILNEWLGDIDRDTVMSQSLFPFFVRVGCVKMSAPRHERFQFLLDVGRPDIDRVFHGAPLRTESLTFIFPERFMSVHEQQAFMSAMKRHLSAKDLKQVDVITSSPLIVGSFRREQIRILTWDDDHHYNGRL